MVPTDTTTDENKKVHRKARAGRKVEKKKKNTHIQELSAKQRNPKAFAINSVVNAERRFRRHQDLNTKKQHIPLVDRAPLEPPPIIVAIVGPPKVGKTTLIKCLIRNFTRQPLSSIKGPITVISGKRRRITLIECNNDINSMIDIAKIADLVFLLIDGSFGFEMEIFEFLNICQVHGMPKIMGVLTHLDMLKDNKQLKQTKKALKHRFWTEVYPGAKLFYLSGIIRGEYLRNEIERLGRFISVMKFRPLMWQTSHSYLLVDRIEDLTSPEIIRQNAKCDRTVSLYGFVRGIPLNKNSAIHISGCGDAKISDICYLPDPCPLPDKLKKRSLVDKERLMYAPFSGVGGIVYDKDAVYIDLGSSNSHTKGKNKNDSEQKLLSSLIDATDTLDTKLAHSEVQLFSSTKPITGDEFTKDYTAEKTFVETIIDENDHRQRRRVIFSDEGTESSKITVNTKKKDNDKEKDEETINFEIDDEDSENSDDLDQEFSFDETIQKNDENVSEVDSELAVKWKTNLSQKAADAFIARQNTVANLWKLVYEQNEEKEKTEKNDNNEEIIDDLFKVISEKKKNILQKKDTLNAEDNSRFIPSFIRNWDSDEVCDSIRDNFVTGNWNSNEDACELLKLDDAIREENLFEDFEDLETGVHFNSEEKEKFFTNEKSDQDVTEADLMEKKQKLKEKFDAEYDENKDGEVYYNELKQEASRQAELNRTVFEGLDNDLRVQLEGYRSGLYVRIEVNNIPCELITNFDPTYPVVVGGLQPAEESIGYLNVRIKKHRWYNKILKTKDPIIISLGWRKFQTLPVYYKLEDNFRQRMLKYTPEHVTCMATFWGPLIKPGTGFLAVQDVSSRQEGFRIIATGTVVETDQSTQITKKLKLIGEPFKIFRKTAFIKNMFNSSLEIAKFEGARIRTVSGIRGQIKRACSKPEGAFRATFEDNVKLSDIIFCRTWCNVDVPKFYNPVISLLLPSNEKVLWHGMKTVGELKKEKGVKCKPQSDSLYEPVIRNKKIFKPIRIPKRLQNQLPFKDKTKLLKQSFKSKEKKNKKVAVIREHHECKVSSLMRMLRLNFRDKQGKQRREMKNHLIEYKRQVKAMERSRIRKEKEKRKQISIKRTKRESIQKKKNNK